MLFEVDEPEGMPFEDGWKACGAAWEGCQLALVGRAEAEEPEFGLDLLGFCGRGRLCVQIFVGRRDDWWLGDERVCAGVVESVAACDVHGDRC